MHPWSCEAFGLSAKAAPAMLVISFFPVGPVLRGKGHGRHAGKLGERIRQPA